MADRERRDSLDDAGTAVNGLVFPILGRAAGIHRLQGVETARVPPGVRAWGSGTAGRLANSHLALMSTLSLISQLKGK